MSSVFPSENHSLITSAAAVSRCGVLRPNNQDAYLADEYFNMFVVADGVGGSAGGEVASALACGQILDVLEGELNRVSEIEDRHDAICAAISKSFRAAERRIICDHGTVGVF